VQGHCGDGTIAVDDEPYRAQLNSSGHHSQPAFVCLRNSAQRLRPASSTIGHVVADDLQRVLRTGWFVSAPCLAVARRPVLGSPCDLQILQHQAWKVFEPLLDVRRPMTQLGFISWSCQLSRFRRSRPRSQILTENRGVPLGDHRLSASMLIGKISHIATCKTFYPLRCAGESQSIPLERTPVFLRDRQGRCRSSSIDSLRLAQMHLAVLRCRPHKPAAFERLWQTGGERACPSHQMIFTDHRPRPGNKQMTTERVFFLNCLSAARTDH